MVAWIKALKGMYWAADNVTAAYREDFALRAAVDLYWANRH